MTKKSKKRKYSSIKTVKKLRGGFTVPPKYRKVIAKQFTPSRIVGTVTPLIKKGLGANADLPIVDAVLKAAAKAAEGVEIKGTTYKRIIPPVSEILGSGSEPIPSIETTSTRKLGRGFSSPFSANHYKVKFVCGRPSTRTLKRLAKLNGTSKVSFYDKRYDDLEDSALAEWELNAGFNRKVQAFWDPEFSSVTLGDLDGRFAFPSGAANEYTDVESKVYGSALNLESEITIMNINTFLPFNVRISLVDSEPSLTTLNDRMTTYAGTILSQNENAMPKDYLYQAPIQGTYKGYCEVDPDSVGVRASEAFKAEVNIVKSFQKRLKPGDSFTVNYKHFCGPGVRLDKLGADMDNVTINNNTPVGYTYFIEAWGVKVDAVKNEATPTYFPRVLGTGPALMTVNFKKTMTGVLQDAYFNVLGEPINPELYHHRAYLNSPKGDNVQKKFNVAHTLITNGPLGSSGCYIPVTTTNVTDHAKESA